MLKLIEFIQSGDFSEQMGRNAIVPIFLEVGYLQSIHLTTLSIDSFEHLSIRTLSQVVVLEDRYLREDNILLVFVFVDPDCVI